MTGELIQLPLSGGPNETVDPRQLPPGSVISVTNAVYDAEGTYQPRLGYTQLSGAVNTPTQALRLSWYRTELLAFDGSSVWTRDQNGANWVRKDSIMPFDVARNPLENASTAYTSWYACSSGSYRIVAWIDGQDNYLRVAVYDISTNAAIWGPKTCSTSVTYATCFVGVSAGEVCVVGTRLASKQVDGYTFPVSGVVSNVNISAATRLDGANMLTFICAADFGANVYIAYEASVNASASKLVTLVYTSNGSTFTSVNNASSTFANGTNNALCLAISADEANSNLWGVAGFVNTGYSGHDIQWRANTQAPAITAGPFAVTASGGYVNTGTTTATLCGVAATSANTATSAFSHETVANGISSSYSAFNSFSLSSGAGGLFVAAIALASQPFLSSNLSYIVARIPYTAGILTGTQMSNGNSVSVSLPYFVQGSYALCQLDFANGAVVHEGTISPQIVSVPSRPGNVLPRVYSVPFGSIGAVETVLPVTRLSSRLGLESVRFNSSTEATAMHLSGTVGKEHYQHGGYYDGNRFYENGYTQAPLPIVAVNNGVAAKSYEYVYTYGQVDNAGNLIESAPSAATLVASSAPPNVTLTIPCIGLTRRQRLLDPTNPAGASPIIIRVYRSQALESGDNNLYLQSATTLNVITQDQLQITDTTADSSITSNQVLYTISGELQHDAPEIMTGVTPHNNRVFGIGADGRTIYYSQTYSDGVQPAWSIINTLTVDDANEPITALGSLYDKLFIFTRNKIYVLYGDGPSNAGTGAEWTLPPTRLPAAAGCIDCRSVVATPLGLMFQSSRGIELVGPDLQVSFIGLPVSVTTQTYPICASATMCHNTSTVRFCMAKSDVLANQTAGVLVIFDVRRTRWSVHSLTPGGAVGAGSLAPVYASTFHPTLGFVEAVNLNGLGSNTCVISLENTAATANAWLDFGTYFVPLTVQTSWIKSQDLQGYQKVRRVGAQLDYHQPHGLTLTLDYNFVTVNDAYTFSNATIQGFINGSQEIVRVTPSQGKCSAIRLTMTTTDPGAGRGTGQGAGFIGLVFQVNRKSAPFKQLSPGAKA